MKKYLIGALVGILLTALGGHFYSKWQTADLRKDNAELAEQIAYLEEGALRFEADSNQRIEVLLGSIGELQGHVDSLMFANVDLENQISEQENENVAIAAQNAKLRTEIQPVLDANPKVAEYVANLERQNENKDRIIFTLREQRDNDRQIIFNLTEQYQAQVKISSEYLAQLTGAKDLLATVQKRLNLQDKRVALLEKRSKWKTVGTLAAVAVGIGLALS